MEQTPKKQNYLANKIAQIMKNPYFPGILQWPALLVFAFIIYQTLWGPQSAHDNFGSAMTWIFWWPLIPIIFLLLGRFWCAICPFATISDIFQKYFGANLKVPRFLKKYGVWIIDILFILITWSDHVFGVVENSRGSGYLLMLIFTGVVVAGIFFERRTWCRYLCFLGGLSGNYARAGMLELRATPEKCKLCTVQACYKGSEKAPGCPMFEFPKVMDSSDKCNLCGYCLKNCPNDSIVPTFRPPTKELWTIRRPKLEESLLASIIMGIVFVQNLTMLEIWPPILNFIEQVTGTESYVINFTIAFIMVMAVPTLGLLLASWVANKISKEGLAKTVARFGYALIPIDLAAHIAHNLFHLLAEGLVVVYTFLGLFGHKVEASPALLDAGIIQIMQYLLILAGVLGSIYTAYRISRGVEPESNKESSSALLAVPYVIFLVVLGLVNVVLFYLPMAMRM